MIIPFKRSYVVIPGKLIAGYYLGSNSKIKTVQKLTALANVGVNHIIDLVEKDEFTVDGMRVNQYEKTLNELIALGKVELTYESLSIQDMSVPSTGRMREILDSIDKHNFQGETVYIHCFGGFGRTGTVVGCFLKRHGMVNNDNYHEMISYLRRTEEQADRPSPQRQIQHDFIKKWRVDE